jgi:hypothetical protein
MSVKEQKLSIPIEGKNTEITKLDAALHAWAGNSTAGPFRAAIQRKAGRAALRETVRNLRRCAEIIA